MANVILMANYQPGLDVCKYMIDCGEEISRLYVIDKNDEYAKKIIKASRLNDRDIFTAASLKELNHTATISKLKPEYIITVYWPYLLKPEVFNLARKGTINFHPALLPINRGWYPHVHSIIDGSSTGVTLHAIAKEADAGPIWAQKEVSLMPYDTAKTIYQRLQVEIVNLFKETWPRIKLKKIKPYPQDNSKAVYHKKSEVSKFDYIDLNKEYKARDIIKLLRARSFGDKGFAYFVERGKRIFVSLKLSKNNKT